MMFFAKQFIRWSDSISSYFMLSNVSG